MLELGSFRKENIEYAVKIKLPFKMLYKMNKKSTKSDNVDERKNQFDLESRNITWKVTQVDLIQEALQK